VHGARRFLGELNLLTGEGVYLTGRVVEPGEVIQISADRLTQIVAGQAGLGDLILGTRRGRQPSFWRAIAGRSCSWFGATALPRRCRAT
jgi:thioredoxin reductase (NADPH)